MKYYICKRNTISDIILQRCVFLTVGRGSDDRPDLYPQWVFGAFNNEYILLTNVCVEDEVFLELLAICIYNDTSDFSPLLSQRIAKINLL